jgi:hypothetical protein
MLSGAHMCSSPCTPDGQSDSSHKPLHDVSPLVSPITPSSQHIVNRWASTGSQLGELPRFRVVPSYMVGPTQRARETLICKEFNMYFAEPSVYDTEAVLRCEGRSPRAVRKSVRRGVTPPKFKVRRMSEESRSTNC